MASLPQPSHLLGIDSGLISYRILIMSRHLSLPRQVLLIMFGTEEIHVPVSFPLVIVLLRVCGTLEVSVSNDWLAFSSFSLLYFIFAVFIVSLCVSRAHSASFFSDLARCIVPSLEVVELDLHVSEGSGIAIPPDLIG